MQSNNPVSSPKDDLASITASSTNTACYQTVGTRERIESSTHNKHIYFVYHHLHDNSINSSLTDVRSDDANLLSRSFEWQTKKLY